MKASRLLLLLLVLNCCDKDEMSPPIAYLNEFLDIVEQRSVNRNIINWQTVRSRAMEAAAGAQTTKDLYSSILYVIRELGDHHSSYDNGSVFFADYPVCLALSTTVKPIEHIGYLKVGSPPLTTDQNIYARILQDAIKEQDSIGLKGWIVDLRGNMGGNMWPMLTGVGPILGEGVAGHFIYPDGTTVAWRYESGKSKAGNDVMSTVLVPYELFNAQPKVAVLLDQRVASSGEAIAIAFLGRPNTKSFGIATCGLSTSNEQFILSDGAKLTLTTSVMADRNMVEKGKAIAPDVTILDNDEMVMKAVEWINEPI